MVDKLLPKDITQQCLFIIINQTRVDLTDMNSYKAAYLHEWPDHADVACARAGVKIKQNMFIELEQCADPIWLLVQQHTYMFHAFLRVLSCALLVSQTLPCVTLRRKIACHVRKLGLSNTTNRW